jgi:glycosyltransferase involved in cell wall biosynthesis
MRRKVAAACKRALTGPLDRRFELLHEQVRNAQQMAALAYDAAHNWPATLETVRSADDYSLAYDEPEPLVTVRIATFNRPGLLCERALGSVLNQTYERWEAIVVGEAAGDETEQRVKALGDDRIRFVNLPFRGPYPANAKAAWQVTGIRPMNEALRLAKGRWICPLDDDDEFAPDHIETLLAHVRDTRAELGYGKLSVVDYDSGQPLAIDISRWPPEDGAFNFLSTIYHSGLRVFKYDPACQFAGEVSDWNLARRMWQAGVHFSFSENVVGTYYLRGRAWHQA